jgi:hypothetical protein
MSRALSVMVIGRQPRLVCSSGNALLNVPRRIRWSVKIEKQSVAF